MTHLKNVVLHGLKGFLISATQTLPIILMLSAPYPTLPYIVGMLLLQVLMILFIGDTTVSKLTDKEEFVAEKLSSHCASPNCKEHPALDPVAYGEKIKAYLALLPKTQSASDRIISDSYGSTVALVDKIGNVSYSLNKPKKAKVKKPVKAKRKTK